LSRLNLSFFPRKCGHAECGATASAFGVCKEHEHDAIARAFLVLKKEGRVLDQHPTCFGSAQEYKEYAVAFDLAQARGGGGRTQSVDHCRDCGPKFKQRMLDAGRCAQPETVFIFSDRFAGDLIGVPLTSLVKSGAWENAVMGISGPVMSMPKPAVIDEVVARLSAKRRIGRPRKDTP